MNENARRAKRMLLKKLARHRRTFGMMGWVEDCSYYGEVEPNLFAFNVTFDNGQKGYYDVKLYAKSCKVYGL